MCPESVAMAAPGPALQTRAVPSSDAVTTREPSGLNAALFTAPWCPASVAMRVPLATSHMRAVSSSEAVTMREPSALNTALLTACVCPESTASSPPLVASHTRGVVERGGDDARSVGVERCAEHCAGVARQRGKHRAGAGIPYARGAILRRGDD